MVGQGGAGAPLPSPATWSLGTWIVVAALVGLVCYQLFVDLSAVGGSRDWIYVFLGAGGLGLALVLWRRLMAYFDEHPGRPGEF